MPRKFFPHPVEITRSMHFGNIFHFSAKHPTHISIHSFCRILLKSWVLEIIGYNYMLRNSKTEYNWIFWIIIGYYNWIFPIFTVFPLVFLLLLLFSLKVQTIEVFLQKVYLYIWAVAGHELGILSIWARSFNSWLISQYF